MKKNSFIEGTIVATMGIIIVKIIGIIYVIPFNAIIGEQGGALYGYAYNIYQLFLSISTAGFPFAISKITSEYNALGYYNAINKTYKEASKILIILSVFIFLLLFTFAPQVAKLIIGTSGDISTYKDVGYVIRMVSFSLLVIPFLSVTRGLLQGCKYITSYTVSQIIEQIVRVIVILAGSYLFINVFDLGLTKGVGVAVLGSAIGGLFAYLYLYKKVKQAKILKKSKSEDEISIEKKDIIKKILSYSIPFIAINIIYNLYNTADMILLSRTMGDILKFNTHTINSILSIYTTWGVKINSIILAISTGLITSLIPNIVTSYTKKDYKDVNDKFNKSLQCILLIIVPVTIFLSMLANSAWTLFYGQSEYGPEIYKFFVFIALFGSLYTVIINILQGINKYKLVITSIIIGLITNIILDIPLILLFNKLGFNPSYGAILGSILGFSISTIILLIVLVKKFNFNFKDTIKRIPSYIISWITFIIIILLLKLLINTHLTSRLIQIPILITFGIVSFAIYLFLNYKFGNLKNLLKEKRKTSTE